MAEEIFERVGKTVKACTNCFVAGTLVATAVGLVPIEEIRAGDWVWARDEVTGEVRLCEVEETYRNESSAIVEVEAGGETIATTPGHPFWVVDEGWKDAGDLEVGDRLVNLRGESVVVEDIRRRPVPEAVYNFSVAGLHTYFVGRGGIWVHNNSGPGCGVGGNTPKGGTYKLKDGDGTVKRTGRTTDLSARERQHGRSEETKDLEFEVDRRTDVYDEQRGAEHRLYEAHPEARSENGGLNKIRAIRDDNPHKQRYIDADRQARGGS